MRHYVNWEAIFLLHVLTAESKIIEGNLPNVTLISNFINDYVKPYIKTLDLPRNRTPGFRASEETTIDNIIRQKILELKPFLKDDDHKIESEENLTLNGGEETTIIEFAPNVKSNKEVGRNRKGNKTDVFKADIKVYKKLREKITKALKKEPVSDKTVKLVTNTFDGLVAKLIGSQCMWKSGDTSEKTFRFGKPDEDNLFKMHNITREEWEYFKHQYVKLTQNKFVNETLTLFNKMQGFFSRVINTTISLSKKYRVNCRLIELKKSKERPKHFINPNVLRDNSDVDECADFEICSNELAIFMNDFYNSLNDTAVSAFRNYAAMYSRDVTDHSYEKDSVVDLINSISNTVERKVIRIFAKETKNIKLDENKNKETNLKILMQYINSTTGHVKRHIKKHLERYLKSLRLRLLLNVKKDMDVNLSVDLENLGRDFVGRICTVFITCNGRYLSRRAKHILNPWGNLHVKDGKSVYVKVQLTFDDALTNAVKNRKLGDILNQSNKIIMKTNNRRNYNEKYKHFNITRTTMDFNGRVTSKIHYNQPKYYNNRILIEMKHTDNVI